MQLSILRRLKAPLILLFLAVGLLSDVAAQNPADALDRFMQDKLKQLRIPGMQLAVIQHGKVVKLKNYGLANVQDNIPVTNKTTFSINSIAKAFTGVAVMQLVEAGKLDLSAPISSYLDSLPQAWRVVTIRQLLTHSSGLPDIWGDTAIPEGGEEAAWKKVQTMPMDFKTGEQFRYNQTNYLLIGKVIEKLSGKPFAQFIKEQQLVPTNMPSTFFGDAHDVVKDQSRGYTFFHTANGRTIKTNEISNIFEEVAPFLRTAAGIYSTAEELAKWVLALQQHKLITDKKYLDILWTPGLLNNGQPAGFTKVLNGYAIGTPVIIRPEHRAIAPIGGGRSVIFIYPDDDLAVIVLTNMQGSNPESFVDEIAGHYIPDMLVENGFGLPPNLRTFRSQLLKRGFENTMLVLKEDQKADPKFQLSENDLNAWAYTLKGDGKIKEALEIFKLNVALYPTSGNTYDSLAETYAEMNNKELAIKNYKKALELDPGNNAAKEYLQKNK